MLLARRNELDAPRSIDLAQHFPNPFNSQTTMVFSLPTEQFVSLAVYDLRGREIERLVHEHLHAGDHSVTFDGSFLPTAMFLVKLETASKTIVNKMILIK